MYTESDERSPSLDKPCNGGNHFTLGYKDQGYRSIYICPNKECRLHGVRVQERIKNG